MTPSESRPVRLVKIDILKGVLLFLVLIDHCDYLTHGNCHFRLWTLMGLGFSDAAEIFVLLSGITLGWAYSPLISRDGPWLCFIRIAIRAVRIYFLILMLVAFAWLVGSYTTEPSMKCEYPCRVATLLMQTQPFGTGILCCYVLTLPFTFLLLLLSRRNWYLAAGISFSIYFFALSTEFASRLFNCRDWSFNPLSWQMLMFLGVTTGLMIRKNGNLLISRFVFTLSVATVIVGIVYFKISDHVDLFTAQGEICYDIEAFVGRFSSKCKLGPIRLLHSLAIAILISTFPEIPKSCIASGWFRILGMMGQHSLLFYCFGLVLTYILAATTQLHRIDTTLAYLSIANVILFQWTVAAIINSLYSSH